MKNIYIILFLFLPIAVFSQLEKGQYYIQFSDKEGSIYSIEKPNEFLSQRAIDRRIKQGIEVSERDFPVNSDYVQGISDLGFQVLNKTKWLNGVTIQVNEDSSIDLNALSFITEVIHVGNLTRSQSTPEKNFFRNETKGELLKCHKDSRALKERNNYDYGLAEIHISSLKGEKLHQEGFSGEGIQIAVLDAGFIDVPLHPAFASLRNEGRILGTKNFVDLSPNATVYESSTHGSSVLSLMAGFQNSVYVGTAPQASYYLLLPEDRFSETPIEEYNWVTAAEYADSLGVDIINSSLGYVDFDLPKWDHKYKEMDGKTTAAGRGASIAVECGILVFCSNGNDGSSLNYFKLGTPADGIGVVSVGSVSRELNYSGFSSLGYTFDDRVNPLLTAIGQSVAVCSGDGTHSGSGTSFSSPILAGMAACLLQKFPGASMDEIKNSLIRSASQSENPDNKLGYGIPDFEKASNLMVGIVDEKMPSEFDFTLYPNPTKGSVNILAAGCYYQESLIKIFTIEGALVYEKEAIIFSSGLNIKKSEIDLVSGMYIVQLFYQGHGKTRKLMILE